ncbi:MAG: thiamine-phosphate kinase [Planctomycetota bacterium]|jgi:thiamine-monophosphate kinase
MSAGEDEMTAWFARQSKLSKEDFPIGIGDDMAQVRIGGESVLVTTDMLLDGVHFDLSEATLEQAGYKAMAVSLSDCAAMATIPVAAVVSVALPASFGREELKQLHAGITRAGERFGCALVGGDITGWNSEKPFAVSVAMLSKKGGNEPVTRSGAKAGDCICVTGSLGGSRCGRHLDFEPRIAEAMKIAQMARINSMIDVSDGLSTDLNRICKASGVGAILDAEQIPISPAAQESAEPLKSALNDGEDFELLFTLSQQEYRKLSDKWDQRTPITQIGVVTDSGGMQIRTGEGRLANLQAGGYEHLKN